MGHRADPAQLAVEHVAGVGLERRAEQQAPAVEPVGCPARRARRVDALDGAPAGRVALEVRGVDLQALDRAGRGEPDDRPVVAGAAAAPGLPAVGHAARRAGLDQVVARAEEHVAARSTTAPCSSAARSIGPPSARSRDHRGTTSPWTRRRATPPSGKMSSRTWVKRRSASRAAIANALLGVAVRAACAAGSRVHAAASSARRSSGSSISAAYSAHALGVVAAEERGVDDDAADHAGHAEPDDAPVVDRRPGRRGRPPSGGRRRRVSQPSIHLPRSVYSCSCHTAARVAQQVLLLGEELVVAGDRGAAEASQARSGSSSEVGHSRAPRSAGRAARAALGDALAAQVRGARPRRAASRRRTA